MSSTEGPVSRRASRKVPRRAELRSALCSHGELSNGERSASSRTSEAQAFLSGKGRRAVIKACNWFVGSVPSADTRLIPSHVCTRCTRDISLVESAADIPSGDLWGVSKVSEPSKSRAGDLLHRVDQLHGHEPFGETGAVGVIDWQVIDAGLEHGIRLGAWRPWAWRAAPAAASCATSCLERTSATLLLRQSPHRRAGLWVPAQASVLSSSLPISRSGRIRTSFAVCGGGEARTNPGQCVSLNHLTGVGGDADDSARIALRVALIGGTLQPALRLRCHIGAASARGQRHRAGIALGIVSGQCGACQYTKQCSQRQGGLERGFHVRSFARWWVDGSGASDATGPLRAWCIAVPDESTLGRGSVSSRTLRLQLRHLFVVHRSWTKAVDLRHQQQGSGLDCFGRWQGRRSAAAQPSDFIEKPISVTPECDVARVSPPCIRAIAATIANPRP